MTLLWAMRLLVIASAVVAASIETLLATLYHPGVMWIAAGGFVLLLAAGERLRAGALPILMAALYLTPALLLVTIDMREYGVDVLWILPLLGLTISGRGALEWSVPDRWKWPLVTWAAMVAVSWPIVFLREANFAPWILLHDERVSNTSIGVSPSLVDQNVAYFAIGHLLGILFLDALCRWYRGDGRRFRRDVLSGLVIAAATAAVVTLYQGFVDLGFLNRGFWEYMLRASGTLADPNKLGAVMGFWTIGALVYARRTTWPWSGLIPTAGLVLGAAAVWLSGSRTGLAAVFFSVVIAGIEALRWSRLDLRKLAAAAAAAAVAAMALVLVLQNASTHTVGQRGTWGYLPFVGDRGILESANELLWDRFGYGPVAIKMIEEHPIDGVGVGMYHALSYDFGKAARRIIRAPDNAQAWWRHNLAELGFAGFIPLLWWCVVFGRQLFSSRGSGDRLSTGMLRGILIAFFIASLFGVPSQSAAITMTFWVFVFWFAVEDGVQAAPEKGWPLLLIAATVALIAVHAGMTIVHGYGDLRPQNRAQRFDWYYRYGYVQPDDVEPDPGGGPIGRRWTTKDSLAVIKVKGKVLKFVAWVDHPDSDVRPVRTQIWADSVLVYEGDLRRNPIFLDIPATPGKTHMVIETSVDRLWRPSEAGNSRDRRELGLSIRDWQWE